MTLILLMLLIIPSVADAQSLAVRHRDGSFRTFPLSAHPKVLTGESAVTITTASTSVSIPNNEVLSLQFRTSRADVNRDFHVDISDVVSVINTIGGDTRYQSTADVNSDGRPDISDVVAVINRIAGRNLDDETSLSASADMASTIGDALYVFRNDGEFNAFLRYEPDSITFTSDTQLVHTPDSTYSIPLAAIDSVSFIQPETRLRPNVILMDEAGQMRYLKTAKDMRLVFSSDMPTKLRPKAGDVIITSDFDNPLFDDGFIGKVKAVDTNSDGCYVDCDSVYEITDIYERLIAVETIAVEEEGQQSKMRKVSNTWKSDPANIKFNLGMKHDISDGEASLSGYINGTYVVTVVYNITLKEQYISLRIDHDWNYGATLSFSSEKSFGTLCGNARALPVIRFPHPVPVFKFQISGCPFAKGRGGMSLALSLNGPTHSYSSGACYRNGKFYGGYHRKRLNAADNNPTFDAEFSLDGSVQVGYMLDLWLGTINAVGNYIRTGLDFYIGPQLSGNFSMKASTDAPNNYYSTYKDSKVDLSLLTVDYEFFGEASAFGHKFPRAMFCEGTLESNLHKQWYVFPEFSDLDVSEDKSNMSATIKTTPSRTLAFPLKVGVGLYDSKGNVVAKKYETDKYRVKGKGFTINQQFGGLNNNEKYTACPLIQLFGADIKATPTRTFTIDGELVCPDSNHPHAIDLGIGVKWACCNVGASAPEQYGGYYAWGETEEKSYYSEGTYAFFDNVAYNNGKSYSECFKSLGSDIAGTSYDVAHVKWGGGWRMPSRDQIKLLLDNCSSEWTSLNGVDGRVFTGPNGGKIFLPAAGCRWGDYTRYVGYYGYYWSSTQCPDDSNVAYYLYFGGGDAGWLYGYRDYGRSVRPVTE